MPAPLDLAGRRFGRLVVLKRGDRVKFGTWQASWICRCDCGAEITVPQNRLPHRDSIPASQRVEACQDCRSRPCVVCGSPIPPSTSARTCSEACRDERQREHYRAYYHRQADQPGYMEARNHQARDRRRQMSEQQRREHDKAAYRRRLAKQGRDGLNAAAREMYASRMDDPDYRERRAQRMREYRKAHADQARRYSREHRRRQRATNSAVGKI